MTKRKRFRRLKQGLKLNQGATPVAGSPLDLYQQYVNGSRQPPSRTLAASSRKGMGEAVWLNIFSSHITDLRRFKAVLFSRAKTQQSVLGLSDNELGYLAQGTDPIIDSSFVPAKMIIFVPAVSQVATTPKGFYSGRDYNPREGQTYTYPFGIPSSATSATASFSTGCQELREKVTQKGLGATMSFVPERIYGL